MSEPRLYLYRKAGREVWDAEMWLPDGRRRVWRTGIVDKDAAMAAAWVRLEALAGVQAAAPNEGGCMGDEFTPEVSPDASAGDAALVHGQVEPPLCAAIHATASTAERPLMQVGGALTEAALPSEERVQTLQTPEKAGEMGALGRFDRWFFGDLASLWG